MSAAEALKAARAAGIELGIDGDDLVLKASGCLGCGACEHANDPLLPFGTDHNNHARLDSRCWPAWHACRQAEAVAALAMMGIAAPVDLLDDFGKNGDA